MRKIDKRLIQKALEEFKDFEFKSKTAFCVIYETFGNKKGYKICDGQTQLRDNFQAELGEVVIWKNTIKEITKNFTDNIDPLDKGYFNTYNLDQALSLNNNNFLHAALFQAKDVPSYMVRQLIVVHKTKETN